MRADVLLAEVACDGRGDFEIQDSFVAAELEDDRTHWVVCNARFAVDEVLPFDAEDPAPRLIVEARHPHSGDAGRVPP